MLLLREAIDILRRACSTCSLVTSLKSGMQEITFQGIDSCRKTVA